MHTGNARAHTRARRRCHARAIDHTETEQFERDVLADQKRGAVDLDTNRDAFGTGRAPPLRRARALGVFGVPLEPAATRSAYAACPGLDLFGFLCLDATCNAPGPSTRERPLASRLRVAEGVHGEKVAKLAESFS